VELHFEDQPFQLAAVDAAVGLFSGQQPVAAVDGLFFSTEGVPAIPNGLDLGPDRLRENLHAVQETQRLPQSVALELISYVIDTVDGPVTTQFPNYSVEMETGTGKTYVYIRTALELARRYGMRKFIIVVPSIAVREGVLKTFQLTRQHFRDRFPDVVYRYYPYRSNRLTQLADFAAAATVEFMIVTLDSFNKESNIMRQRPDGLGTVAPLHVIQATRPILILDEPQNMESELSRRSLASLHPLFALRYSATHRNAYNAIYRLTPYQAYRAGLVKHIRVASALVDRDANQPVIQLLDVIAKKRTIAARFLVQALGADGAIRDMIVSAGNLTSLADRTNRPAYDGYDVRRLDAAVGEVEFANGVVLRRGESIGVPRRAIFEAQIARALDEHIRRQTVLDPHGVKVLTLFFIDRVANYIDGGVIRQLFDARFLAARHRLARWAALEPHQVQAAYFAQKRRKTGALELLDSSDGRQRAEDETAFVLIMRAKERLLSFAEPVCFIFSHSALREGWDNPNVFQIVTLNESVSETRKRQEIGRGMRLAVDQNGDRVAEPALNVLTVIANESYKNYVAQLQVEVSQDEADPADRSPLPEDADNPTSIALRPDQLASPEFARLWARISRRTRYQVSVDTDALVHEIVQRLEAVELGAARIVISTASVEVSASGEALTARLEETTAMSLKHSPQIPDLLTALTHQMEHTTPPMRLTRRTLHRIVTGLSDSTLTNALQNPQAFITEAARIIKETLADALVDGIRYLEVGSAYDQDLLDPQTETYVGDLVTVRHGLTDKVPVQSGIERRFVDELDRRQDVPLFLKLPRRFVVATPVGNYNPDWAIVVTRSDKDVGSSSKFVYMVRETKGGSDPGSLRPNEARKIRCGMAHFRDALGIDYAVATDAEQIIS
jgi:type III restriction enzyme